MKPHPRLPIRSALAALACLGSLQAASKPNILFIYCDDLGYGDLGTFHQNERAAKNDRSIPFFTTPHIDAMAASGMKLGQHYTAAPVCAPARASLFTGTTQGHAGVRDNQFDKALPKTHTLASVLKQAGYATALAGKWGLQGKPRMPEPNPRAVFPAGTAFPGWPSMPADHGFDDFLGYVRHKDGHYHYPVEDQRQLWHNQTEISGDFKLCFSSDLFTAYAKKWIVEHRQQQADQPFFFFLSYDTPHAKIQRPPCAYPEGGGLQGGVQWTGKKGAMLNTAKGTYDSWLHPDYAGATWDHDRNPATAEVAWPEVQKLYANLVRRIDDHVGDLMQLLDDLKIADNTLVVFSSDNGPSEESYIKAHPYRPDFFHGFGPFEGIKRDVMEGGLRVPTIARLPGTIPAASSSQNPSGQWDWLATFADLAGIPAPASSDGVSLVPALKGMPDPPSPSQLYSEYFIDRPTPAYQAFDPSHRGKKRGQMQVVFVDGYKGIRSNIRSADDDFEIYELRKDPKELNNLAKNDGFAGIQARMKARALQMRVADPSAPRPYDQALIPALPEETPLFMPGCTLYEIKSGIFPWMPDLREQALGAQPGGFALPTSPPPFAIKLESAIHIPGDGSYTFSLSSDSHAMLFVHDIRLLGENPQPAAGPRSATLPLKAGWHPVKVLYRSGNGSPSLSLSLQGPDGKDIPLNAANLKTTSAGW